MAAKSGKSSKSAKSSKPQSSAARDRSYAKANHNGVRVIKSK